MLGCICNISVERESALGSDRGDLGPGCGREARGAEERPGVRKRGQGYGREARGAEERARVQKRGRGEEERPAV